MGSLGEGDRSRLFATDTAGRGPALVLLALVLCFPGTAGARQVWADEEAGSSLELGGFSKTTAAGMLLPQQLVENANALMQGSATAADPMPEQGAFGSEVVRLQARLLWGERLDFEAAWQLGASAATHSAFASGLTLGGSPAGTSAGSARRLVDLDGVLGESDNARLVHDLDRLSAKLSLPGLDVVAGRQVLSWGSGRLWNPTDLLSPFSPTDLDKEVRRGVDALRISVPLGETGLLDVLWLPQRRGVDQGGVVRGQANFFGYDFSLSAAKYVSDLVFGADFSGDAGPLGVHGEAAWTLGLEGWGQGSLEIEERFVRAVGGIELRPLDSLVLMAEYHFNGFGASAPDEYLGRMQSERVARGEVFGAGRHYLGLVSSWAASDLLSLQATALVNLQDPSAMLVPMLEWSAAQSVLVRVGAFLPLGERPTELRTLGADGLQAARTLGIRSEYGTSAAGVMAQLAVHL